MPSTAWETASFVTRALGAHNQQSQAYSFAATLLFLLAPLWVNAYVYMTAGRLIWAYHPDKKVWGFKAISLGKYFVWLDVFSFLVQAVGGVMLSPGGGESTMKTGKNICKCCPDTKSTCLRHEHFVLSHASDSTDFVSAHLDMTGVGVQQLFILLFFALIVRFQIEVQRFEASGAGWFGKRWQWVTYALYAALALISMRIIFRLVEFSAGTGVDNPLPYHEKYALALDAFPMTLAILILAVIHPGLALKGAESEFPSRKERKTEKKKIKAAKKAEKDERKMAKRGGYSSVSDIEMNSM
ncbi:hypothetical protein SLS60_008108 [Paraconiothyrium brasiliense]|uniref:Uncharacterized protein n=1 Tax=Paraconiothyrium brasiliense TaxID=300254 RepID=A0ABR3R421_9PLEO